MTVTKWVFTAHEHPIPQDTTKMLHSEGLLICTSIRSSLLVHTHKMAIYEQVTNNNLYTQRADIHCHENLRSHNNVQPWNSASCLRVKP
jgi:hypothetical protein